MVSILGGTFQMGQDGVAAPVHSVTVSAFSMGKYEVTQEQYQAVMGSNPSNFSASPADGEIQGKRPVEHVSWYDAIVFCHRLSMMEGLVPAYTISGSTDPRDWGTVPSGSNDSIWDAVTVDWIASGYRLPTEAEWEYACRAGTTTAYNTGDTISDSTGWYSSNSGSKTHEVGKKPANAWGLYDMHGNVDEWCWDWYGSSYYSSSPSSDPQGPSSGSSRVRRGGSWSSVGGLPRSADRGSCVPWLRYGDGFRLVRP
jgi:formylglycine-generating enzyme required for sulfatase activity